MIVSLFTDASFCGHTKVGGWGCWVKSDRGHVETGGSFIDKSSCSNAAEIKAIANGLHIALTNGVALPGDEIIVYTDCVHAVLMLNKGRLKMYEDERRAENFIEDLVIRNSLVLEAKHVKGHVKDGKSKKVHRVNKIVDAIARRGMKSARLMMQTQEGY